VNVCIVTHRDDVEAARLFPRDTAWGALYVINWERKGEEEMCVRKDLGASMARTRLCNLGRVYV